MKAIAPFLTLVLAGCATTPRTVALQEPVIVRHESIVAVPEALTRQHPVYERADETVGAYMDQADANTEALRECNADKADIRALPTD